jgi:cell division transport system permease protein
VAEPSELSDLQSDIHMQGFGEQATKSLSGQIISALRGLFVQQSGIIPSVGTTGPTLVIVLSAMCFLASLALGAALIVNRTTDTWTSDLTGVLTVQIKPQPGVAVEDQIEAALTVLNSTVGVQSATALSRKDTAGLLEPWLGEGNITQDLPLPRLIDVVLAPEVQLDTAALAARLNSVAPGIVLDTHRQWLEQLLSTAIAIFATRSGLSANHGVVEVLHLIGAHDRFIATEIQTHFLWLGLRGGIFGFGAAALTFLALSTLQNTQSDLLLPIPSLAPWQYLWLACVPVSLLLTVTTTAHVTVLRTLGKMV